MVVDGSKPTEMALPSREITTLTFENCSKGLGVKIVGGCSLTGDSDYGVFVKRILPHGLADSLKNLNAGDQILSVNGDTLEGVTNERAVALLRKASASGRVTMVITRDSRSIEEFTELIATIAKSNGASAKSFSSQSSLSISPDSPTAETSGVSRTRNDDTHGHSAINENETTRPTPLPSYVSQPSPPPYTTPKHNHSPAMTSTPYDITGCKMPNADTPTTTTGVKSAHPLSLADQSSITSVTQLPDLTNGTSDTGGMSYSIGTLDSEGNVAPSPNHDGATYQSSIDSGVALHVASDDRIQLNKLFKALKHVGIETTDDQVKRITSMLTTDETGLVKYADFVDAVQQVVNTDLTGMALGVDLSNPPSPSNMTFTPSYVPEKNETLPTSLPKAHKEIDRLKALLHEREQTCNSMEEEILQIRKDAQGAIHESRSLRSKVHLAEQAQKAARTMEHDYEDVVRMMEGEITQLRLKSQNVTDSEEWQKRIAILTCQLKKTESAKKSYEVATEKLLKFVEYVHETLRTQEHGGPARSTLNGEGEMANGDKPPGYLGNHKALSARSLANQARDIVKAVKAITDSQPLPYGWEEAYTPDAVKYYINHLTQTTSWSHPISNVQHVPFIKHLNRSLPESDA